MWHDWREAAYRRIREQHFMDAFDAVIEAWPEREQPRGAVEAFEAIRDELGVPTDDYSAPVANARKIADDWLTTYGGGKP